MPKLQREFKSLFVRLPLVLGLIVGGPVLRAEMERTRL